MPDQRHDLPVTDSIEESSSQSAGQPIGAAPGAGVTRRYTRRKFMAIGGAAALAGGAAYYAGRRSVEVGIVGMGGRGAYHAQLLKWMSYGLTPYGNVSAICDVDLDKANQVKKSHWPGAQVYQDYRDLLANDKIKAVFVVTPDHWHTGIAIDAMRAGKAVYVEKPVSLTIEEGFLLRDVAVQTGAVVQVGTQQRSHQPFHTAWELVRNGRLGKLRKVVVSMGENGVPSGSCIAGTEPAPRSLDWNMWVGPTASVEYCRFRHEKWWGIAEYSGGMVTNWGSHNLDIALWITGKQFSYPSKVDGRGTIPVISAGTGLPNDFDVTLEYPDDFKVEMRTTPKDHGILFVGEDDRIFVNRARTTGKPVENLASNPLPADALRVDARRSPGSRQKTAEIQHYRDFFDCIATGETPIADVKSAVCCVTALHLANISIALGRSLHFDSSLLAITNDAEASAMTARVRRSPFVI